jgi:hypothetical protein
MMAAAAAAALGQPAFGANQQQRRGQLEAEEEYHRDGQVSPHAVYEDTRSAG